MKFSEVFSKLSSFKPSKDNFEKVTKEIKLLQTCQNKLSESFLAAAWYKKVLLEPLHFTPDDITAAADQVSYEEFNTFHNNLMKNLHFEWLI
jgi:secreted Zn-dependent insulinase-like peptidase